MLIVGRIKIGKIDFFQRKDKLVRVVPVYVDVTVVCAEYGKLKVDVAGNAAQRVPVFTAELSDTGFAVFVKTFKDAARIRMNGRRS